MDEMREALGEVVQLARQLGDATDRLLALIREQRDDVADLEGFGEEQAMLLGFTHGVDVPPDWAMPDSWFRTLRQPAYNRGRVVGERFCRRGADATVLDVLFPEPARPGPEQEKVEA